MMVWSLGHTAVTPPMSKDHITLLGLDIGSNSVGWALVRAGFVLGALRPLGLLALGVRVFPENCDGDRSLGQDAPRNRQRREARKRRRMLDHRARRLAVVASLLQGQGLLPSGPSSNGPDRHRLLKDLDARLWTRQTQDRTITPDRSLRPALLPCLLRHQALKRPLEPFEIGRALFHLARRRGSQDLDQARAWAMGAGQVMAALDEATLAREGRGETPGSYLSRLARDGHPARGHVFSRCSLRQEFEAIWAMQAVHQPRLLDEPFRLRLAAAIFAQRPQKKSRTGAGPCSLEKDQRRAPWSHPLAQRFRLLLGLNDLRLLDPARLTHQARPLDPDQRARLLLRLETAGDASWTEIRSLLGLSPDTLFNPEATGSRGLPGDRLAQALLPVFGPAWLDFDLAQQSRVAEDLRGMVKPEALAARGRLVWSLTPDAAQALSRVVLEPGCCALSRKALARILPHLEAGLPLARAVALEYPDQNREEPRDRLPPLFLALDTAANPVVSRALGEMRKVVNALIREHGKPGLIRVELARDLGQGRGQRRREFEQNQKAQAARETAARDILAFRGHMDPPRAEVKRVARAEVERLLLARECRWACPYTGQALDMAALFGPEPGFDLEHIIPLSRRWDTSLANKTLCAATENRLRKAARTPREAYAHDPERYARILARVEGFDADPALKAAKLRRFLAQDPADLPPPAGRLLSDAAQAGRKAREYLGLLYGSQAQARVQALPGRATARMRAAWNLNALLGPGGKNRQDHRHHALDALAVALCGPAELAELAEPWPGFRGQAREMLQACLPSHRVCRKARGELHQETLYGLRAEGPHGPEVVLRKPLTALRPGDILSDRAMPDRAVRQAVREQWEDGGRKAPARFFADPANLPPRPGDPEASLRRVRVPQSVRVVSVGQAPHARLVHTAANHHLAVFEGRVGDKSVWRGQVVTLLEAMARKRDGRAIVDRQAGPEERFLFSLARSEVLEIRLNGITEYLRLRTFYPDPAGGARLELVRLTDARRQRDMEKKTRDNGWFKFSVKQLGGLPCRKVRITPLGRVVPAND